MRQTVLRIFAVVVSLAMLAWVLADARWQGVAAKLARLDAKSLVGVTLLFAASYAMRAARIHGEIRDEIRDGMRDGMRDGIRDQSAEPGRRLGYLRILRLTLVHNALVNVLPFRSGEAAFPVLLGRWFGIATGRAVVSLLWLRAQDATVVLTLAAVFWPGLAASTRIVIVLCVVVAALAVPRWARAAVPGARLARWRSLLERATRRNLAGWLWTVGNWTVKLIAEAWLVGLALETAPTIAEHRVDPAFLGAVGAELAAILPVQGIAGFGTFEAGGAALMRTQGLALQSGVEAVLMLHAVVLALALVAGLVAVACLPGRPRPV